MGVKIAITGGIGCGKSRVTKIFAALGFSTFSCDEIYKEVIRSKVYVERIATLFPDCVQNGEVNRKKLSAIVFLDPVKLQKLNAIAHPLIMQTLCKEMEKVKAEFVFAEVPLLYEGGFEMLFDYIVVVRRNFGLRIDGVTTRDGLSQKEVENRIRAQVDYNSVTMQEKLRQQNVFIIDNNGSIENLEEKVRNLLMILRKK